MGPERPVADVVCVVPTHDRGDLLVTALEGIATQTLLPREVLVVDDSDAPPPSDLVGRDARWPFPVTLVANPGRGASSSRNLGAGSSTSSLIAFLDDDDWWGPAYLQRAVTAIADTGTDAAITWLMRVDVDGRTFPGRAMPVSLGVADVVAVNQGMTGSNIVVRRQAFDAIGGFDARLPVSNDKDFLVRFLDAGLRYTVVTERLVFRREHPAPRLTRPSAARIEGLRAYEAKHASRLTSRQRWQLRAKRARAEMRHSRAVPRRISAVGRLLAALAMGGMAEGIPLPVARAVRRVWHRATPPAVPPGG